MKFDYVFDSYAWIEYFRGSEKGETVRRLLEESRIATPTIVLAEISDSYGRENHSFLEKDLSFITAKTAVIDLTADIAVLAGKVKNIVREKYKTNFGLADAIILQTARKCAAKVVTGDEHFKNIQNTVFL
ncbi:MAG: PIN domain-containing protein [Candidatus Diapherotrites archaeon]